MALSLASLLPLLFPTLLKRRATTRGSVGRVSLLTDRKGTLRQMRDLRRYQVPVTINNPKQVNIAADGAQQVNVQGVKKPRKASANALPGSSGERVNLGKARKVKTRASRYSDPKTEV